MRTLVGQDQSDWLNLVWTWIHSEVPLGARVFIPAGNTPLPLYRRWREESTELLRSLHLLQLDDILTGPRQGEFRGFLQKELAPFTAQIEWINQASEIGDVAILGVGVNGHVAFHEPGLPRSFFSGCVRLNEATLQYLNLNESTWGITYGVDGLSRARQILVLARGEAKKNVLTEALKDEESKLPIRWILEHPNVTLISDFAL